MFNTILNSIRSLFSNKKSQPIEDDNRNNSVNDKMDYHSEKLMKEAIKDKVTYNVTIESPHPQKKTNQTKKPAKYEYIKARKLVNNVTIIDFETTGFDPVKNEIIQVGAIKYIDGIESERFLEYAKPSGSISSRISRLTGISDETVSDAPPLEETLKKLVYFLKKETLVAHNASFDMKFLLENLSKFDMPHEKYRVIDTLTLARRHISETENHKLPTLKKYLEIEANSHDAIEDCFVTGKLYYHCKTIEENSN